ncbi:methylated-DNA--[protein]-cysteine S-methyltransferase [Jeotgalibacillus campisalis]|uniref:Methylated-DNA--protein-cysteine methyltransferase n=1 Tax=Jeotgalibacillus campisalis TaxID=220754 RepID=A0A0C2RB11_9BACL|nr:methylated-DNA--[protein]-cysteine S-methyltransferase [Jeotgalibacillus campisalis]KIL47500.1 methylated-DNA--protein-cysteine methyltransferase [Jeotgalibacillus campisalis]
MNQRVIKSPIHYLKLTATEEALTKIEFLTFDDSNDEQASHIILDEAEKQLSEYFNGQRKTFDLPLQFEGTSFQKDVWSGLKNITYGTTCSYQDLARQIGRVKAVRAVGQANRRNPLPIVIPCHRVVGKNGSLTGYAGSEIDKKEILLQLEKGVPLLSEDHLER